MKKRHALGIAVLMILTASLVWAQDELPSGLTFHASFDGTLDADFARGETTGTAEGSPEFVEGHQGQGLMTGDIEGPVGVLYPVADNFDLERGSLAMWVQPVNWGGETSCYRLLFRSWLEAGGLFMLYRHHSLANGMWFFLQPTDGAMGKMYARSPIKEWQPGEWHHVASPRGDLDAL